MTNLSSTFEQLHSDLDVSLVACRARPTSHAIHSLRTSMRRIEALLRKVLDEHPRALRLRSKIQKVLDELKEVRRAAGRVRDLDVQRMLIVEIATKLRDVGSIKQLEDLGDECTGLDHVLRRRRKREAAGLVRLLKDAEPTLERALDRIPDVMKTVDGTSTLKTARTLVLRSSLALSDTSVESLHSYRKRINAARYLAEMQGASRVARRLVNHLKRILDDIGRWHDLLLLDQEAKELLGKRASLTRAIHAERDSALRLAIAAAGSRYPPER